MTNPADPYGDDNLDAHTDITARIVVEVTAGVIPGTAEPAHTRRFVITAERWALAGEGEFQGELLADNIGRATGYATLLMLQPDRLNWVRVDFIYL
jgi:hypothetical protein